MNRSKLAVKDLSVLKLSLGAARFSIFPQVPRPSIPRPALPTPAR